MLFCSRQLLCALQDNLFSQRCKRQQQAARWSASDFSEAPRLRKHELRGSCKSCDVLFFFRVRCLEALRAVVCSAGAVVYCCDCTIARAMQCDFDMLVCRLIQHSVISYDCKTSCSVYNATRDWAHMYVDQTIATYVVNARFFCFMSCHMHARVRSFCVCCSAMPVHATARL
jgi:hypothetical protein